MAMQVIQDDLWLCDDCTIAAVNGDFSGLDMNPDTADHRQSEIMAGLERLGPHLVADDCDPDPDGDPADAREPGRLEFSWRRCDCCRASNNAGSRTRFAVLGPV